jgi:hypothetical protein
MKTASPSELREMLSLMKEFGASDESLTRIVMNAARQMGIPVDGPQVRCPSVALFISAWKEQTIPLPLIPCQSSDLYQAFEIWCERNQEETANTCVFGRDLVTLGLNKFHSRQGAIVDPSGDTEKLIQSSVTEFKKAVEAFRISIKKRANR